jgi:hypothetical protein
VLIVPDSASSTMQAPATPMIHPPRNAALFAPALEESSIKMIAMIGIGLIATPTAKGNTSPMA